MSSDGADADEGDADGAVDADTDADVDADADDADSVDADADRLRRTLRRVVRAVHGFHQGYAQVEDVRRRRED